MGAMSEKEVLEYLDVNQLPSRKLTELTPEPMLQTNQIMPMYLRSDVENLNRKVSINQQRFG